jgi:hypothetical protein
MKIDPGFPTHWKTERLIEQLGAEGIVVLLRIWGQAQIRREWKGLQMTPKRLAMETKWKGDENHLFSVLTDPDCAWLDIEDDGTVSIHGFEEHQKQVIHLWSAGGKGGRPKKVSPEPSSKKEEDTSTSSSSYPICEPNGNQMVSGVAPPSFDEVSKFAKSQPFGIQDECIEAFFDEMESLQWTYKGVACVTTNAWHARFRRYATNWSNNRTQPNGRNR